MKTVDYRNMSPEELAGRLSDLRLEYVTLRARVAEGREKNSAQVKTLRREIARLETVIHAKAPAA
jgi:large subunit ribosomal protein L29